MKLLRIVFLLALLTCGECTPTSQQENKESVKKNLTEVEKKGKVADIAEEEAKVANQEAEIKRAEANIAKKKEKANQQRAGIEKQKKELVI